MTEEITAVFPDVRRAELARRQLLEAGLTPEAVVVQSAKNITAREGGFMGRVVLIIAAASILGAAVGVGIGAVLALTIGPNGASGFIIQTVSWGVCLHVLAGILAGYALLSDRTEREILSPLAELVIHCDDASADALTQRLAQLGASDVRLQEDART